MIDVLRRRFRLGSAAAALMAGLALGGCGNAGEDRVLSIPGNALVGGLVYLDQDGDRQPGDADAPLAGVRVRLLVTGTRDTAATAASGADGVFAFGRVPVGRYTVVVTPEPLFGDSVDVVRVDTSAVDLTPDDTVEITVAVSYPLVSVAEARALPLGTKAFIQGVALNFRDVFADTILHVRDTSAAIRITATQGPLVTSGDSARVLGRVAARDGQPVLDRGQVIILAVGDQPGPVTVSTAQAASADGGRLDAALVRIGDATISDSATVNGDYVVTVADTSGTAVLVVFDQDATGLDPAGFVPGVVMDATGLLVPDGAGAWRVKPRTTADVVVK
jgi:hypothetical protein